MLWKKFKERLKEKGYVGKLQAENYLKEFPQVTLDLG